jgi:site-specific DNA recombinase
MLHGDKPPFGYRLDEDKKQLVAYEPEAEIVRLVFHWYTRGDETGKVLSSRAIAKRLTEMQVPSWSDVRRTTPDRCNKRRDYGEWGGHMVLKMLHNETYKGVWHYAQRKGKADKWRHNPREEWIPLEVPALVSEEVWHKAQAQATKNAFRSKRNTKYEYLMRRRMSCKECGYGVNAAGVRASGKLYRYYRCNSQTNDLAKKCVLPKFRADQVDEAIWFWVRDLLIDPKRLEIGLQTYKADLEGANAPIRTELKTVERLLEEEKKKLQKLLDLYLADELSKEMLLNRKVHLEAVVSRLEARKAELESQVSVAGLTDEEFQDILDYAKAMSEELTEADSFETRQRVVDLLDVTALLSVDGDTKVIDVRCVLDRAKLVNYGGHFSKCGVSHWASTE